MRARSALSQMVLPRPDYLRQPVGCDAVHLQILLHERKEDFMEEDRAHGNSWALDFLLTALWILHTPYFLNNVW